MNTQIREAAAQWLVEFRTDTPGAAAKGDFAAWLQASPEHIRAYLDLLALWEDARCYDPRHKLDIDSLVALARTERTVSELGTEFDGGTNCLTSDKGSASAITSRKSIRSSLPRLRSAIAALLSIIITGGVVWFGMDWQPTSYSTPIGEQRSVQLPDGSRVDLDGDSNVRTNFTPHERILELVSGEALFHVTKDASRPFVVHVGAARVRAVGTEFDVNRTTLRTVVTVVEGRVAVFAPAALTKHLNAFSSGHDDTHSDIAGRRSTSLVSGTEVDAGQQTTITRDTVAVPQAVDTAAATAWTRSVLVFSSTPLSEVADEINRFDSRRLVIASPELADVPVTGTFRAFDPDSLSNLVRLLRAQPGIEVFEKRDQIIVQTHSAHRRSFTF